VASIKQRSRRDSSCYWDVMFRLDGRQRSVSFQTQEHAEKFRSMVDLVGPAKALEVYRSTRYRTLARTGSALNSYPFEYRVDEFFRVVSGC
jgi:hypothetical protein